MPVLLTVVLLQIAANVPGTYDVVTCSTPCTSADSARIAARGVVVLFAPPAGDTSSLRRGCAGFAVQRGHDSPVGTGDHNSLWEQLPGSDTVRFTVWKGYHGERYELVVAVTDTGFSGSGNFWQFNFRDGVAAKELHYVEAVTATRRGPPDYRECKYDRYMRRSAWLAPLLWVVGSAAMVAVIFGSSN